MVEAPFFTVSTDHDVVAPVLINTHTIAHVPVPNRSGRFLAVFVLYTGAAAAVSFIHVSPVWTERRKFLSRTLDSTLHTFTELVAPLPAKLTALNALALGLIEVRVLTGAGSIAPLLVFLAPFLSLASWAITLRVGLRAIPTGFITLACCVVSGGTPVSTHFATAWRFHGKHLFLGA